MKVPPHALENDKNPSATPQRCRRFVGIGDKDRTEEYKRRQPVDEKRAKRISEWLAGARRNELH